MVENKKTPVKKAPVKKAPPAKKAPAKKIDATKAVAETETVVDNAVETLTAKATKHIDPKLRDKANHLATEAEAVATKVENFGESVGSVTDSIFSV